MAAVQRGAGRGAGAAGAGAAAGARGAALVARGGAAGAMVPDMPKRRLMNVAMFGAIGLPATAMAGCFAGFFVPNTGGGGGGGQTAKDALGNDVTLKGWLAEHKGGDHSLTQGLKGDPTYIIVKEDGAGVENFGVNSICTHLGCVVPWNAAENKFKCPCHGSQYNFQGKVVRGPAPLSLALAHLDIDEKDNIVYSPWTETDFRTGLEPWWK